MKHYRFTSFSSKEFLTRFLALAMVSGSLSLASCEDEVEQSVQHPSSKVMFSSKVSSSWTSFTRAGGDAVETENTMTELKGGDALLYLHTLYTDSIALPSGSRAAQKVETRATPVKNENMYDKFGVSAYAYTGSWDNKQLPNYFYNATASKSANSYVLASDYYWPGNTYNMKFFAYAPMDNASYTLSGKEQPGAPVVSVTIPSDVSKQQDLLVARTEELSGAYNQEVALVFQHALTAVRFVCADGMQKGTIKTVTLKDVYSVGKYHMEDNSWKDVNTPTSFSQTLTKQVEGTDNEVITTEAQTFMMVPQTLPDGAQLEVVFVDENQSEHTLTADLKGSSWPMGKTVTYRISTSSISWTYEFCVTDPGEFEFDGGTKQYTVTSYRKNGAGVIEPVSWIAQYSEDNGVTWSDNKPSWLVDFTAAGEGSKNENPTAYSVSVDAQVGSDLNAHTQKLRDASPKGTEAQPYNLANATGATEDENSANCYVVSAPGYYSIPLIYGNARKDSRDNTEAFSNTKASGRNILRVFRNHVSMITAVYINNNAGVKPVKAELLGQDALNLVTDVKYNPAGNGTITFKVDQSTIRQGNALIAIKDATDQIIWSWHIWVTGEDLNKVIQVSNAANKPYSFMPVVLGWCDERTTTYQARSCKVKFTAGENTKEITIVQKENEITFGDNHPYYQWGRKDPFLPSNGYQNLQNQIARNESKRWFGPDGLHTTANPDHRNLGTGNPCIQNYIKNPEVMHSSNSADNTYYNLWDSSHNGTTGTSVKSVYDPCPVGFKVPDADAFTGFTTKVYSDRPSPSSEVKGNWNAADYGWNFTPNGKSIFFPALGWRDPQSGGLSQDWNSGNFWTSAPNRTASAYYLYLKQDEVGSKLSKDRSRALGIRPVKE